MFTLEWICSHLSVCVHPLVDVFIYETFLFQFNICVKVRARITEEDCVDEGARVCRVLQQRSMNKVF